MSVTPIRPAMPSFDHRPQAPVEPVAQVAQTQPDDQEHDRAAGTRHAHNAHQSHVPGHGPTPRPRRSTSAKTNRSRRRRRAGAPAEDDEIELAEAEFHADGVASVGFQDEHPDGSNDEDEGERERSRHERLGRVRGHWAEQLQAADAGLQAAHERSSTAPPIDAFVSISCGLVAAWQPGDRAAIAMQRAKLQLLRTGSGAGRFDSGGLARVVEHLRSRMPTHREPGNPMLNLMLPLLILQLQLGRTPDQLDEAIARVQASVWGAR